MTALSDLKPQRRDHVFDLAKEAGFDVSDWLESSNNPRGAKANPKYCYEWSYVEPGKLVLLNLWHKAMRGEDGRIFQRNNFRADAEYHRKVTKKSSWAKRARRLDEALQTALRENLPVRVIINDGDMRDRDDPELRPSKVKARQLDPEPWTISSYDWATGEHELTRGIFTQPYIDQFDLDLAEKAGPERKEVTINYRPRDPAVRQRVKARSEGKCELCGRPGFPMANGAVYLETHHIVPLSEGGPDTDDNVVALCADGHRRAHFGADREGIAVRLKAIARPKK